MGQVGAAKPPPRELGRPDPPDPDRLQARTAGDRVLGEPPDRRRLGLPARRSRPRAGRRGDFRLGVLEFRVDPARGQRLRVRVRPQRAVAVPGLRRWLPPELVRRRAAAPSGLGGRRIPERHRVPRRTASGARVRPRAGRSIGGPGREPDGLRRVAVPRRRRRVRNELRDRFRREPPDRRRGRRRLHPARRILGRQSDRHAPGIADGTDRDRASGRCGLRTRRVRAALEWPRNGRGRPGRLRLTLAARRVPGSPADDLHLAGDRDRLPGATTRRESIHGAEGRAIDGPGATDRARLGRDRLRRHAVHGTGGPCPPGPGRFELRKLEGREQGR